jgi:hypothetical protein
MLHPTPALPDTERLIRVGDLPQSLQWALTIVRPEERYLIETCLCRMALSRDLVDITRFVDQTWNQARNAEYRTGGGRITGAEMDGFRARMDEAVKSLLDVTVDLALRAGFTEIMQRNRRVLARHGHRVPKNPAKAPPPRHETPETSGPESGPESNVA